MTNAKDPLERLVTGNAYYANKAISKNPDAFTLLSQGQRPQILWIGCAGSHVPETTICHCKPGDIFVHRNIANAIHADDVNAASVVEYAVTHLKVNKVVVCGHTKCGGTLASLTDADMGETLNKWLHPIRELRRRHRPELDALVDDDARASRVAALNVRLSIDVLEQHPAIRKAIIERGLTTHGFIYDLTTGQLKILE
ncbi:carbonic anhydrase [Lizonia empirigonia]|nr:carbonic anhydrase [Lizonia empirigonia]